VVSRSLNHSTCSSLRSTLIKQEGRHAASQAAALDRVDPRTAATRKGAAVKGPFIPPLCNPQQPLTQPMHTHSQSSSQSKRGRPSRSRNARKKSKPQRNANSRRNSNETNSNAQPAIRTMQAQEEEEEEEEDRLPSNSRTIEEEEGKASLSATRAAVTTASTTARPRETTNRTDQVAVEATPADGGAVAAGADSATTVAVHLLVRLPTLPVGREEAHEGDPITETAMLVIEEGDTVQTGETTAGRPAAAAEVPLSTTGTTAVLPQDLDRPTSRASRRSSISRRTYAVRGVPLSNKLRWTLTASRRRRKPSRTRSPSR
jgi:hypothetical protein